MVCGVCLRQEIGAHYIPGVGEFLACAVCYKPLCDKCAVLERSNRVPLPFCHQHVPSVEPLPACGEAVTGAVGNGLQEALAAD